MDNWTNAKFCDVANLILGAILFFSPWMFGFDAGKVSENANIAGLVIAVLAIAALAAFAVWEEWLNLIVGLWVLVSPWVLGFQGTTAMSVHVVIGAAVARLQPNGMACALFATALAQALVLAVALIMLITRNPQVTSWTPPELRGFGGNAFFVILFAGSALLFRKAGRGESAPGAV